jgi:hypothetical protein
VTEGEWAPVFAAMAEALRAASPGTGTAVR